MSCGLSVDSETPISLLLDDGRGCRDGLGMTKWFVGLFMRKVSFSLVCHIQEG